MIHITLVAVGKIKEKYFAAALDEYTKRLSKYCRFEIVEVREFNDKDRDANVRLEAAEIAAKLKGHVMLCDIRGEEVSSERLAAKIEKLALNNAAITFVVGGSHGVGAHLDGRVGEKISFGPVTLPHQLFRVILAEQIYRAFTILNNESYHK